MAAFAHLTGRSNRQLASQVAGVATVAIATVALFGAWWGPPLLAGWQAGLPLTGPFEALCLAALGIALIRPGDDILAVAVGLAVAAVGAVDLGLDVFGAEPEASPWALFDLPSAFPTIQTNPL